MRIQLRRVVCLSVCAHIVHADGTSVGGHERNARSIGGTPKPALDGDHERMAHLVLEGVDREDGEFVAAGPTVVEGVVMGTPVRALCGKVWVPRGDPKRYPLCPTCKEIAKVWAGPSRRHSSPGSVSPSGHRFPLRSLLSSGRPAVVSRGRSVVRTGGGRLGRLTAGRRHCR